MLGRMYEGQNCSAARALEIVGERWSLVILRDAMFRGTKRFSDFQRSVGAATNILAKRLEGFVTDGLMQARAYGAHPEHREYHLTEKGLALKPVIVALTEWGDEWVTAGPVVFEHKDCGGRVELQLRCTACDATPPLGDVVVIRREKARKVQRHTRRKGV